jgi:predicted Zn-dependent protease
MTDTEKRRHYRVARLLPAVFLAVLLSACGGLSRMDRPAEVEERGDLRPPAADSETQIAAYTPPAQPRYARPEPKRAVAVLMRRSEDQRLEGDLDGATVSLERALRIAPEDAVLWHELAQVRMAQQRHDLVVQLAAKSNALADPADSALRGSNWRLIAQARRALGDAAGAREAERRAASLR